MSWFPCDDITDSLKSESTAFLYCMLCKSLEESILSDTNRLEVSSRSILDSLTSSQESIDTVLDWADPATLTSEISDVTDEINDIVPYFNDPVQTNGSIQTTYNRYMEVVKDLPNNITPETLGRVGLNSSSAGGMIMPTSFLQSSGSYAEECANSLLDGIGLPDIGIGLGLLDLLSKWGDIGAFIRSLINAINGYASIGCSPSKGLEMETNIYTAISGLPLDVNYDLSMDSILNDLTIPQVGIDNMNIVNDGLGNISNEIADRFSI